MNLKKLFIKHLLIITIVFPLLLIFFYGGAVSFALKYKHEQYAKEELQNYEQELKENNRKFLKEKAKYIASFMEFIYTQNKDGSKEQLMRETFRFISSITYDNGFIYFYHKKGNVINIAGHPCGEKLLDLVHPDNKESIISKLMNVKESGSFLDYKGTDCQRDGLVNKVAIVEHIRTTNYSIVISENAGFSAIERKKDLFEEKLNDELSGNLQLLLLVSLVSILFSLIFSKVLNMLIVGYEREVKNSNNVMFAQSRLAQAGELLTMIAHQWRQPMGKIASTASGLRFQMMMGKEIDHKELDRKLEEIEEYTEFASETINDFQRFYKPKKIKTSILVLPVILKSIEFLESEISKKSMVIKKEFDKDMKVLIYENELIQVLVNILQNAIEFSDDGASISIETKREDSTYVIRIKDEAGGIKKENIDKIFEANFSTKSDENLENLGLGLYVSKVIIERHFNGKLEVLSEKGHSTFIIRLPR